MTKLVIDIVSGTVIDLDNCYLVNGEDLLSEEIRLIEEGSDSDIIGVAITSGRSLDAVLQTSGYGDVTVFNSVSYSPNHLRDEADAVIDSIAGLPEENEHIYSYLKWVRDQATDDDLNIIGQLCLADDDAWRTFRTVFMSNVFYFKTKDL